MIRAIVSVVALATLASAPTVSRADDASEAQLQYELGAELYRQRRYPEALERFLASNRLVPNENVVFNIAQVYALMDRHAEAFNWYETFLADFDVEDADRADAERAQAAARAHVAILDVHTAPEGATLYVDRVELGAVGRAPRRVAVQPGERSLIARLAGHRDARVSVTAAVGESRRVDATLEPIVGTVSVASDPGGAEIRIEGSAEALGTTPLSRVMPVGDVRLVVRLPGYVEQTRTVRVREGEETQVALELVRAASEVAVLSVVTDPAGAVVRLDGEPIGETPLTVADLGPGARRLSVDAAGREGWETDVLLEAGSATRVNATLVDPSDRPWPGWRWLGYGSGAALVVAGAVVGVLALSARSSFYDDPNPTAADHDRVDTLNLAADVLMGGGIVVLGTTLLIDLLSAPAAVSSGTVEFGR